MRRRAACLALAAAMLASAAHAAPKPRPGEGRSASQSQCGTLGGQVRCDTGSPLQRYGAQRVAHFGPGTNDDRRRITAYSDGSTATTTRYGNHSVTIYSDGRVVRCQMFGAQQVCN